MENIDLFTEDDFKRLQDLGYTCPLCFKVMEDPAETECGHLFCVGCITHALKSDSRCPTCRKDLAGVIPFSSQFVKRLIANQPVACCFKKCDFKSTVGSIRLHAGVCKHASILCPCGKSIFSQELKFHKEKECAAFELRCPFSNHGCSFRVRGSDQLDQHLQDKWKEHATLIRPIQPKDSISPVKQVMYEIFHVTEKNWRRAKMEKKCKEGFKFRFQDTRNIEYCVIPVSHLELHVRHPMVDWPDHESVPLGAVGHVFEGMDTSVSKYRLCQVYATDQGSILVRWLGWDNGWDEWIPENQIPFRLRKLGESFKGLVE